MNEHRKSNKETVIMVAFLVITTLLAYIYAITREENTIYMCTSEYIKEYSSQDCQDYYEAGIEESEARQEYLRR